MLAIHPNARTTPAVRAEIACSREPTGVLAQRYGVSPETIRKWRKRGADACQDRSSRPHTLPWKATEEERAIVCALRRATGFPLKDDETEASAVAFPFKLTHVLTDRGSCFTADGFEAACRSLRVEHRTTRPYTPQTNGLAERFNGRVQREVLGITIYSHTDLEHLLHGFNQAYNARRQRVLKGASPDEIVRQRLKAEPKLGRPHAHSPPDPNIRLRAMRVIHAAKDVSQLDNSTGW